MKLRVVAYDPDIASLVTVPAEEATQRGLTVYPDPYAYDPFKLFVEGDTTAAPKRDKAVFPCPKCGQLTLQFYICGLWD